MSEGVMDTVLLVCSDPIQSKDLRDRLHAEGFQVIGPASSAAMAMALAAQIEPTVALVARQPTGRRKAAEFARDLMRTWGVGSVILRAAEGEAKPPRESRWLARPNQAARFWRALGGAPSASRTLEPL